MKIREVNENKKQFISLLLLADEQESMVDRYLEKGTMYVLEDNDVKAWCGDDRRCAHVLRGDYHHDDRCAECPDAV